MMVDAGAANVGVCAVPEMVMSQGKQPSALLHHVVEKIQAYLLDSVGEMLLHIFCFIVRLVDVLLYEPNNF